LLAPIARTWLPDGPVVRPRVRPVFRVLVHHKYLAVWNELADTVGLSNARQFWDHVGKHNAPKWPGYSKTIHYEITGPGASIASSARPPPTAHAATPREWSRSCPSTWGATEAH
jgi:hypothetical protein